MENEEVVDTKTFVIELIMTLILLVVAISILVAEIAILIKIY